MTITDELRRVLGPVGIWMPPPAGTGLDAAEYGRAIEAAGFTSVWFPRMNSAADLAAVEPTLAATDRLVLGTGIASVWTWTATELRQETNRLAAAYPGRFILGLGVSHAPIVESSGQAYVRPYSKMVQFLDELGEVDAPVMLAALGPKMLELSRMRTVGAHPYFTPPEHTAFARQVLTHKSSTATAWLSRISAVDSWWWNSRRASATRACTRRPSPGPCPGSCCRSPCGTATAAPA
jgi:probable F420-dependent oxidoreductase